MDYYNTLGLKRGASADEIKKAYRSMAMKHHPDRGGDASKFKEIEEAYRTLSDPQKKEIFDLGGNPNDPNQGRGGFHFNSGNFEDIFSGFGFGGGPFNGFGQRPMRRNRSVSVNVEVTLEEVLTGKSIDANIGIPGGKQRTVSINIPAGIETGQQIRYQGMGDNTFPDVHPGDLIVNVFVKNHPRFRREGESLIFEKSISVWEAMGGSTIEFLTLDNKTLRATVPAGTQPDTVLSCKNEGLPNVRNNQRGNLLIKIKVSIPKNLTTEQINSIKEILSNS
jgi:curved DNA-binding protein